LADNNKNSDNNVSMGNLMTVACKTPTGQEKAVINITKSH